MMDFSALAHLYSSYVLPIRQLYNVEPVAANDLQHFHHPLEGERLRDKRIRASVIGADDILLRGGGGKGLDRYRLQCGIALDFD
jgi:hypothetical protein